MKSAFSLYNVGPPLVMCCLNGTTHQFVPSQINCIVFGLAAAKSPAKNKLFPPADEWFNTVNGFRNINVTLLPGHDATIVPIFTVPVIWKNSRPAGNVIDAADAT